MITRGLHVEVIIIRRMKIQTENTYSHEMAFRDIIDPFLLLTGGDLRWIGGRFQHQKHSRNTASDRDLRAGGLISLSLEQLKHAR